MGTGQAAIIGASHLDAAAVKAVSPYSEVRCSSLGEQYAHVMLPLPTNDAGLTQVSFTKVTSYLFHNLIVSWLLVNRVRVTVH